jgi:hypothetical protein
VSLAAAMSAAAALMIKQLFPKWDKALIHIYFSVLRFG